MKNASSAQLHSAIHNPPRGFALLLALIFTAVILSVSLSLGSVTYDQVVLSSTARQSQYAFYNADAALECALFQDQKNHIFDYGGSQTTGSFMCEGQSISWTLPLNNGTTRTSSPTATFQIPCAGGSTYNANVTVFKQPNTTPHTIIYANGFNDCNASDPQRVERGLQSHYN